VHNAFDEAGSCTTCHRQEDGSGGFQCLDCHDEIGERVKAKRGLHASFLEAAASSDECVACHAEHKGLEAELIPGTVRWRNSTTPRRASLWKAGTRRSPAENVTRLRTFLLKTPSPWHRVTSRGVSSVSRRIARLATRPAVRTPSALRGNLTGINALNATRQKVSRLRLLRWTDTETLVFHSKGTRRRGLLGLPCEGRIPDRADSRQAFPLRNACLRVMPREPSRTSAATNSQVNCERCHSSRAWKPTLFTRAGHVSFH